MINLKNIGKNQYFSGFNGVQVDTPHDMVIFSVNSVGYAGFIW